MYETGELVSVYDWEFEKDNCIYGNQEELRKIFDKGLKFKVIGVFHTISTYIVNGENSCMIDGDYPTLTQLSDELYITKPALNKYLKLLEENDFLKIIKTNKQTKIIINPNLYFGRYINLTTHELFKNN